MSGGGGTGGLTERAGPSNCSGMNGLRPVILIATLEIYLCSKKHSNSGAAEEVHSGGRRSSPGVSAAITAVRRDGVNATTRSAHLRQTKSAADGQSQWQNGLLFYIKDYNVQNIIEIPKEQREAFQGSKISISSLLLSNVSCN